MHMQLNQAQCLLNLSGDAVLLQPEHDSTQEPVDPLASEISQDQSFDKMNLLPVPDPVNPSNQSDSTSTAAAAATTSQVSESTVQGGLKFMLFSCYKRDFLTFFPGTLHKL